MQIQANLLPPQYRPQPSASFANPRHHCADGQPLSISIYWLTLHLDGVETWNKIQAVENEIAQLQHQVDENLWREELQVRVNNYKKYIDTEISESVLWHPAASVVERAMVPGLRIDSLDFSPSGDIRISGEVNTIETAAKFWGSIQAESVGSRPPQSSHSRQEV